MRELYWMARAAWRHTAHVLALQYNSTASKGEQKSVNYFNPFQRSAPAKRSRKAAREGLNNMVKLKRKGAPDA